MRQRILITSAMTLIASLLVLLLIYQRPTVNSASSSVDAWPPFTMNYKEEGQVRVFSWGVGTQSYEFVFNNTRDWTHTITDSTHKEFVGSYQRYTGETLVQFEASSNDTTTTDTSKDHLYIPDQWLSFGYIKGMQQMPNVSITKTDDPALEKLIEMGEMPCEPTEPDDTNCKPGEKVRIGSREITYRIDTLIPVMMVDKIDGVAVYTATVEKLEFR